MENDNLNIEQELDQMKQQYALLQEELNQQRIADEKLLFEAANSRLCAWQKRQIRAIALLAVIFIPLTIYITILQKIPTRGIVAFWGVIAFLFYIFYSWRKAYRRCTTLEEVVDTMAYINSITSEPKKIRILKAVVGLAILLMLISIYDDWVKPVIIITSCFLFSIFANWRVKKKQRQTFKDIEDLIEENKKE